MRRKLIIDGNAVYEIDDECARCKEMQQEQKDVQQRSVDHTVNHADDRKISPGRNENYRNGSEIEDRRDIRF